MENLFTIIEAWKISYKPTPKQAELAQLRANICDTCPHKKMITNKTTLGVICSLCNCPLEKKVYTNKFNPCPLQKWVCDEEYIPHEKKIKKSFL